MFGQVRAGEVRRKGDLAGVDLVMPGASEPVTTLAARRFGSRWLLVDVSDARTP
jgi:hypothetical protein